jgi:hypothetical protein
MAREANEEGPPWRRWRWRCSRAMERIFWLFIQSTLMIIVGWKN